MSLIDQIAERRLEEAVEQGELQDLPGAGQPLVLDDDSMVPEHLRTAYRVLKNANCIPPELAERQEIRSLEDLIDALYTDASDQAAEQRSQAERRLSLLRARLESSGRGDDALCVAEQRYRERLLHRFSGPDRGDDSG
ncbi:DnaJ family domain-containing protein [Halorhodospira halophila]|uniref:DnaJ homologue subfamily C member 28 conserved domain-containing protein n=1 Tax=Halorhodospira halophila (strain DSM 244 / SL1) TaxID=349124 RepID=A1WUF5_HALHL|nr:DnaJ family domain-containing protein [Halorhodospira halophila]ABM61317.1 conserved hypothetical protein [Halorhodospira halophila SL1]MBK1729100.1 DUF1992 domain-containing protein [Halorhodospira halophila]